MSSNQTRPFTLELDVAGSRQLFGIAPLGRVPHQRIPGHSPAGRGSVNLYRDARVVAAKDWGPAGRAA